MITFLIILSLCTILQKKAVKRFHSSKYRLVSIMSAFCLAETGSWSQPVCVHLHSGPSHLDQPAVLGSHFLQRGPESDQIPVSELLRGEAGHRQATGKKGSSNNL